MARTLTIFGGTLQGGLLHNPVATVRLLDSVTTLDLQKASTAIQRGAKIPPSLMVDVLQIEPESKAKDFAMLLRTSGGAINEEARNLAISRFGVEFADDLVKAWPKNRV